MERYMKKYKEAARRTVRPCQKFKHINNFNLL